MTSLIDSLCEMDRGISLFLDEKVNSLLRIQSWIEEVHNKYLDDEGITKIDKARYYFAKHYIYAEILANKEIPTGKYKDRLRGKRDNAGKESKEIAYGLRII